MVYKKLITFSLLFIFFCCSNLPAQEADRTISLSINNQRLDSLIIRLGRLSGYEFAYEPSSISADSLISISYDSIPLKEVLDGLRDFGISHSIMGQHIILRPIDKATDYRPAKKTRYTISGYIRDKETGEALVGATISDRQSGKGAMTNGYGFFSLTMPEGEYELKASFLGYKPSYTELILSEDKQVEIKLEQGLRVLEEVLVVSSGQSLSNREAGTGELYLKPSAISKIQGFMGLPDMIKSLQTLPGVNFYGDGSSLFYVRGGASDQNMILIDEAPIYNPAHMLGLFSVFTVESLNSIKVYKGNMPASLGGRISSVIDVKLKEGNSNKLSFHGNTGPVATSLNLEGPLFKKKSSFYLSARRSHFKWLFAAQNENIDLLHFSDFNIKYNYRINPANRLFFSFYSGSDIFKNNNFNNKSNGINWKNLAANLRWNHIFGDRLFSNTSLIMSSYDYNLFISWEDNQRWNTGISLVSLKSDFTFYSSPGNTYRAGFALSAHNYSPGNYYAGSNNSPLARGVPEKQAVASVLYLDFENELLPGMVLNYGLRMTAWNNYGPTTEYVYDDNYRPVDTMIYEAPNSYNSQLWFEPRLQLNYRVNNNLKTSLSYSHNVQFEHLISNSISPFTSLEVWLPAGPNIKPSSSRQLSAGISLPDNNNVYSFDLGLYYKVTDNYISYVDHANMLFNPHVEGELRYGRGRSKGIEALFRKSSGNPEWWISYTLSATMLDINDLNNNQPFPSGYDRPHNFNARMDISILPRWLLSVNFIWCSGNPFTSPTGFYYYNGYQVPFYDTRNNDRLPDYHRLDLSTEIQLNSKGSSQYHSLKLGLYNAYGRKNPFTINFNKIIDDSGALRVPTDRSDTPELQASMIYVHGMVPSVSYHFKF